MMTFKASAKDHAQLKHILDTGNYDKPNYSHWIYKNRSGASDLIIWTDMNLGNMREKCLFVTDKDFNLIDIPKLEVIITTENDTGFGKPPAQPKNDTRYDEVPQF